jgi:hypothetical protein
MRNYLLSIGLAILSLPAIGSTHQTLGPGSAVATIDRAATFDLLDYLHNGTSISDYVENGLFVGTSGDSLSGWGPSVQPYFNPFHLPLDPATQAFYYPDGGSLEWVTIETTDSTKLYGVEFLYGNGWTTGDITGVPWGNDRAYVEWQTLNGGTVVSSGQIGPNPTLQLGSIIGFYDPDGFDQLQVRCRIDNSVDPNLQALALDDLHVQLSAGAAVTGTLELQDLVGTPEGIGLDLEFRTPGTTNVVCSYPIVLDASGNYTAAPVTTGTYDIAVRGYNWLRSKTSSTTIANGTNAINYSLVNGDATGDNSVDLQDLNTIFITFNTADWSGDLDWSGLVDLIDLNIVFINFGMRGDD